METFDAVLPASPRSVSMGASGVDVGGSIGSGLQFVNITSPPEARLVGNKMTVRSHAARQAHLQRMPLKRRLLYSSLGSRGPAARARRRAKNESLNTQHSINVSTLSTPLRLVLMICLQSFLLGHWTRVCMARALCARFGGLPSMLEMPLSVMVTTAILVAVQPMISRGMR
jgi:hypothetical protein